MRKKSEAKTTASTGGSGGARALGPTRLTVLHVDDDPNDTELLQAASRQAGVPFALQHIQDGEHAIAYLNGLGDFADRRRYPVPSLIILDLKLPRTSGFEVLKWMREHPQYAGIPIVVLSGSENQDDIQRCYSMGANSYIVKPLEYQALIRVVETLHTVWLARPLRREETAPATPAGRSVPASSFETDFL